VTQTARAIVHLDLDAFFAAVEVIQDPSLENLPVVVGGRPEGRGVVAAASYPAREYGIHSAMPMLRALALCPDLIIRPPRFRLYSVYSRRVMAILRRASPIIEQMSVDEAYLDLTDQVETWDGSITTAGLLQKQVWQEVGLSASIGIAANKLVAKVASDRDKPGGLTVVRPGDEADFLAPLPVRALAGVGPVTAQKLAEMSVTTVGQLANAPEHKLSARFGKHGRQMIQQARGLDNRKVATHHELKSVSSERTFGQDLTEARVLEEKLVELSGGVARRLHSAGKAGSTVVIKLRYSDFTTLSRQMALGAPTDDKRVICQAALTLFKRTWTPARPVRLLGVGVRRLESSAGQLSLW
jgi:DNA polymerase-4